MTDRYLFSEVLQFGRILGQLIICIKLHLLSRGVSIEQKLPHELHPVSGPEITIGIEGMLEFFDLSNGPTCTVSHQLSQLHQLRYLIYIRLRNNRHGQTWSDSHVIKNRFKSLQKSPDGLSDDRLYWQNQSFRDELQHCYTCSKSVVPNHVLGGPPCTFCISPLSDTPNSGLGVSTNELMI